LILSFLRHLTPFSRLKIKFFSDFQHQPTPEGIAAIAEALIRPGISQNKAFDTAISVI